MTNRLRRQSVVLVLPLLLFLAQSSAIAAPGESQKKTQRGFRDPLLYRDLAVQAVDGLNRLEAVEMLTTILSGSGMGPGAGWFHGPRCRYNWEWLRERYDADRDGKITREEFPGPDAWFEALDRDGDGVLTIDDFRKPRGRRPPAGNRPGDEGPSRVLLLEGLMTGEVGSICEGPGLDQPAPKFTMTTQDGSRTITLSDYRGKKPVVLVFGSFT